MRGLTFCATRGIFFVYFKTWTTSPQIKNICLLLEHVLSNVEKFSVITEININLIEQLKNIFLWLWQVDDILNTDTLVYTVYTIETT